MACAFALAWTLVALTVAAVPAEATDVASLRSRVGDAQAEAEALGGKLQAAREQLFAAEQEAAAAAAREAQLTRVLETGEARSAALAQQVEGAKRRLAAEKRRLRRARGALAARLVSIYEAGTPDEASVILASGDVEELATRTEYLERIQQADARLAKRVEEVHREVGTRLSEVTALKARVDAYNERLAAARSNIAAVRSGAEEAAARLESLASSREAVLGTLKSKIENWVGEIEEAEAASEAAAEETVGRWLGGPYSIPTYIVMCESGGNYGAVNPSSGAGGAYQILPSTWALYGGKGAPQDAPKGEQDRIAAEIWADSGGGAWVCAG